VIAIVAEDAGAPESTLTVATDVTEPPEGGVTLLGENETCTPLGKAPVLKATAELKEPSDAMVTVSVAELPEPTVRLEDARESEKSAPDVTVSVTVVLCVIEPAVPVMVRTEDATAALEATLIVSIDVAVPADGMLMGFVLKLVVTPVGTDPVIDNVADPAKPRMLVPVIVTEPEDPCDIDTLAWLGVRLKSG
jgi:hypothetical protein